MLNFTNNLELFLQSDLVRKISDDIFFIGDFNIDVLKFDSNREILKYLDMLLSYNYLPYSVLPTRITDSTSTLIDHIYYRSKFKQAAYNIDKAINGVIVTDITDHLANCLVLPFCLPFKSSPDRPLIRLFSQENKSKFSSECLSYDWTNNVYNCSDVNVAYDNFYIFLKNTFEKCFPLVKLSRKRSKDKKWITQEIIKLSKIKSNLYKTWVNTHLLSDKDKYKVFVKSYNGVIKAAKSNYYRTTFDSKIHDIKTIWQNINKLHSFKPSVSTSTLTIPKLQFEGKVITESDDIANCLNEYFCNAGKSLADRLPTTSSNIGFTSCLPRPITNSFVCENITYLEIYNVITKLSIKNKAGPDYINAKFLSSFQSILIPPLCHIFNQSLELGLYPNALKVAKTIPIYKKGSHSSPSNYRPISLLSIFGKIFESIIASRLSDFLNKYKLLYDFQFGFRT